MSVQDVLIAGAGPTGLALAAELMRHGVRARVVDRATDRHADSRATDIQARTIEVFHAMGVIEPMLRHGLRQHGISFFRGTQPIMELSTEGVDSPYPFALAMEQWQTEAILEEHLRSLGGAVDRPVRVASLEQNAEHATAVLLHPDGRWTEERFRWVVGCDGAHSTVRRHMHCQFEGSSYEESFVLGDFDVEWELGFDRFFLFLTPRGSCMLLPLPGRRRARLFIDLLPGEEHPLTLETFQRMVDERVGFPAKIANMGWHAAFRIHKRQVPHYREGRVFLAGDAAHVHSPVGGHGMNLGIQDAFNLAWKLALVVRGRAEPTLLDTYHAERHPVARDVISETDMETRMALWRHPIAQGMATALMSAVSALPSVRQSSIASALEIAFGYRSSPICREHRASLLSAPLMHDAASEAASIGDRVGFGAAPGPGERVPDAIAKDGSRLFDLFAHPGHTLLLFDGESTTDAGYANLDAIAAEVERRWGDLVNVHVVVPAAERPEALSWQGSVVLDGDRALHRRMGAAAECLYLVRPDGYVGFRSQPADRAALVSYLESLLRSR